jgi:nanoRNase/pAp phosphatase (c-di-AMP/oligoRNAs hydrolase)
MSLRSLLSESKNILILGHHNADPDAVCSMLAIKHIYKSLNPKGNSVLVCDDVSRLSKQVIDKLSPGSIILPTSDEKHDLVVILDTNSHFQLGESIEALLLSPGETLVIDHHEANPDLGSLAEYSVVDTEASSTCEIVVKLYDEFDIEIDPEIANLLLTGMIFDTRRFFYAKRSALAAALKLVDAGADYERCVSSLLVRPDRSERIARLKAAGRVEIHTIDNWVVVTSKVNAYEASACRALIDVGADVAIVGGKTPKSEVRLSARSTRIFSSKTGVNLGTDVMEKLGKLIGGQGGGHANAAGANGVRKRDAALVRSVELIRTALAEKQESVGSNE